MIVLEDRITLSRDIDIACAAGARQEQACEIAGIDVRTLQRWKAHEGLVLGDGRPEAVRPLQLLKSFGLRCKRYTLLRVELLHVFLRQLKLM